MGVTEEYKLSMYQDYGPLSGKNHIHLVRNVQDGSLCVKKILDRELENVIVFRKNNPNEFLTKVYDYIIQDEKLIVIEEYVEGVTLEEYTMGEPISEEKAVYFGRQICLALKFLHSAKPMIIYRDLKPQNIMVTKDEKIKLVDFDISREFQEGKTKDTKLLGTAEYAAPEQFGYFQTDNRTDIYAFGQVFNYMLTGKTIAEALTKGKYQEFVKKCTGFEPEKRFQTVEEVLGFLKKPYEAGRYKKKKSMAILGFRSRTWWKMIIAAIGYVQLAIIIWIIMEDYDPNMLWAKRVLYYLFTLIAILVSSNFCGISNGSRLLQNKHLIVRIIGNVLVWAGCWILAFYFVIVYGILNDFL